MCMLWYGNARTGCCLATFSLSGDNVWGFAVGSWQRVETPWSWRMVRDRGIDFAEGTNQGPAVADWMTGNWE